MATPIDCAFYTINDPHFSVKNFEQYRISRGCLKGELVVSLLDHEVRDSGSAETNEPPTCAWWWTWLLCGSPSRKKMPSRLSSAHSLNLRIK